MLALTLDVHVYYVYLQKRHSYIYIIVHAACQCKDACITNMQGMNVSLKQIKNALIIHEENRQKSHNRVGGFMSDKISCQFTYTLGLIFSAYRQR